MKADYLKETFDFNSPSFLCAYEELPLWSAPFGMTLLDRIRYKKNSRLLDIGCGTGFPLTEIAQRFGAGSEITGLDPWDAALKLTAERIEAMSLSNVKLINGIAENMPFSDGYFDIIVSNNGLNNVGDIHKTLGECGRVLKKGGQLLFTYNLPESMSEFYGPFSESAEEAGLKEYLPAINAHIFDKRKPMEFFTSLLSGKGFEVKEVFETGFTMKFADGSAFLNHYFIKAAFMSAWKELIPEDSLEDVFSRTEEKLNAAAAGKGLLEISIPYACIDCSLR
jgi:ubiquinone/menaquinone biosynthesis C-methylase UbiE